jgi:uncharacterized membrane protein
MEKKSDALKVAVVAVLTAVVVVFTMIVKIPTAKGYLNLCDVAVCFIAFTFGPWTALLCGGLGAAIADLLSGYAQWAPISFVCHGLEGLLMALAVKGGVKGIRIIISAIVCLVSVAGGYFLLAGFFISGVSVALAEGPGNLAQAAVGFVLGLVVSKAVKRAYPPVAGLAW